MNTKILALALLSISTNSALAGVSIKEARDLMVEIGNTSGYHYTLSLVKSSEINAYATSHGVYVTTAMLNYVQDREELALILGHEIGHIVYRDPSYAEGDKAKELRADKVGYHWCKKAGYKDCTKSMRHMLKTFGDEEGEDHPKWSTRIHHVTK